MLWLVATAVYTAFTQYIEFYKTTMTPSIIVQVLLHTTFKNKSVTIVTVIQKHTRK